MFYTCTCPGPAERRHPHGLCRDLEGHSTVFRTSEALSSIHPSIHSSIHPTIHPSFHTIVSSLSSNIFGPAYQDQPLVPWHVCRIPVGLFGTVHMQEVHLPMCVPICQTELGLRSICKIVRSSTYL